MARLQLSLYNPFSLQIGSSEYVHRTAQTIVLYAESRFRKALLKIIEAGDDRWKWMQSYLQKELVIDIV
jgi:hypothetical protein